MLGLLAVLDRDAVARLLRLSLAEAEQPRTPARLAVKLQGTLVSHEPRFSIALVDGKSVFIGDTLEGHPVRAITKGCVLFDREELCMEPKAAAASAERSGPRHVAVADLPRFTQGGVRVVPVPNGFKLFGIAKGSIYEELGIQSGDIVRTVNGKPVDFSAIQLVRPGAYVKVEFERAGQLFALEGQLD